MTDQLIAPVIAQLPAQPVTGPAGLAQAVPYR